MKAKKRVHFIAIGGCVMHHLAIALQENGYVVTGSDEEIYDPSKSKLEKAGLLPPQIGWFPEKITKEIDLVILGMHPKANNPELLKAKELGIKVNSYPEFIFEQSIDKQRIVIAGSHGKTSITCMILHVLQYFKRKTDYLIGAEIEGFDKSVQLANGPMIVIEGDEFVTSSLDPSPKFLHYHHHIGLISGVEWDHINAYPTFDEYVKQFEQFADQSPKGGILIYSENDDLATVIGRKERDDVQRVEYSAHKHEIVNGQTYLVNGNEKFPVQVFGKHNMRNISAAKAVLTKIGITEEMFFEAIQSFKGTSKRLELVEKNNEVNVFQDYAHAPSKLKASTKAVKQQFPKRDLLAVLELDTYSSLNKDFLGQYKDTFKNADEPVVYFDPRTVEQNNLPAISAEDVKKAFDHPKLEVFTDKDQLKNFLLGKQWKNRNLLLMTSGNFGGINIKDLAKSIVGR
jgi:UDP-N-acetylmuramate: L-alanyl-gamma-D-glutamyl-meso-diaminopimelate ligase